MMHEERVQLRNHGVVHAAQCFKHNSGELHIIIRLFTRREAGCGGTPILTAENLWCLAEKYKIMSIFERTCKLWVNQMNEGSSSPRIDEPQAKTL